MSATDPHETAWNHYQNGLSLATQDKWDLALKDFAKAYKLHSNNVRYALFTGAALWQTGNKDEATALWSLGADRDPMLRAAHSQPNADNMTRQVSAFADQALRQHFSNLQRAAIDELGAQSAGRIASALWAQTNDEQFSYASNGPRPYTFYAPDLPRQPVFERTSTSWTQRLEGKFESILEEFKGLMGSDHTAKPYLHGNGLSGQNWDHLKGSGDWSSVHLFQAGQPTKDAAKCPITCAALNEIPVVIHNNNPMEAFFSVLKPGTHIPPHYGLANCRLTVHLPLVIPADCSIRVADHHHEWRAGETFMFDDSYDHEAWNKSEQTRTVLIFEAWRPDMTEGEITAVQNSYKTRQDWLDGRRLPNLDAYTN